MSVRRIILNSCYTCAYSAAHRTVATGQSFWLVCDNFGHFVKTGWWLLIHLANQNLRTVGGGVVKHHVGCLIISSTVAVCDWCISILTVDINDWRISILIVLTRTCSFTNPLWYRSAVVLFGLVPQRTHEGIASSQNNEDQNPLIINNHSEDRNAPITNCHGAAYNETANRHHRLMKTTSTAAVKTSRSTPMWQYCETND